MLRQIRISNIRSYRGVVDLKFGKTTVIVGMNGSGKTSIIEALRYALTNEINRSLVYSPKLAKTDVQAKIIVWFDDFRLTRTLICSLKNLSQRSLESILHYEKYSDQPMNQTASECHQNDFSLSDTKKKRKKQLAAGQEKYHELPNDQAVCEQTAEYSSFTNSTGSRFEQDVSVEYSNNENSVNIDPVLQNKKTVRLVPNQLSHGEKDFNLDQLENETKFLQLETTKSINKNLSNPANSNIITKIPLNVVESSTTKHAEAIEQTLHILGTLSAHVLNINICHQEDQYWPLNDLKKRLDAILNTTAYMKLIEYTKTNRKYIQSRIEIKKAEFTHIQESRKIALEAKKRKEENESRCEDLENQVKEIQEQIDDIKEGDMSIIEEKEREYNMLKTKIEFFRSQICDNNINNLDFRQYFNKLDAYRNFHESNPSTERLCHYILINHTLDFGFFSIKENTQQKSDLSNSTISNDSSFLRCLIDCDQIEEYKNLAKQVDSIGVNDLSHSTEISGQEFKLQNFSGSEKRKFSNDVSNKNTGKQCKANVEKIGYEEFSNEKNKNPRCNLQLLNNSNHLHDKDAIIEEKSKLTDVKATVITQNPHSSSIINTSMIDLSISNDLNLQKSTLLSDEYLQSIQNLLNKEKRAYTDTKMRLEKFQNLIDPINTKFERVKSLLQDLNNDIETVLNLYKKILHDILDILSNAENATVKSLLPFVVAFILVLDDNSLDKAFKDLLVSKNLENVCDLAEKCIKDDHEGLIEFAKNEKSDFLNNEGLYKDDPGTILQAFDLSKIRKRFIQDCIDRDIHTLKKLDDRYLLKTSQILQNFLIFNILVHRMNFTGSIQDILKKLSEATLPNPSLNVEDKLETLNKILSEKIAFSEQTRDENFVHITTIQQITQDLKLSELNLSKLKKDITVSCESIMSVQTTLRPNSLDIVQKLSVNEFFMSEYFSILLDLNIDHSNSEKAEEIFDKCREVFKSYAVTINPQIIKSHILTPFKDLKTSIQKKLDDSYSQNRILLEFKQSLDFFEKMLNIDRSHIDKLKEFCENNNELREFFSGFVNSSSESGTSNGNSPEISLKMMSALLQCAEFIENFYSKVSCFESECREKIAKLTDNFESEVKKMLFGVDKEKFLAQLQNLKNGESIDSFKNSSKKASTQNVFVDTGSKLFTPNYTNHIDGHKNSDKCYSEDKLTDSENDQDSDEVIESTLKSIHDVLENDFHNCHENSEILPCSNENLQNSDNSSDKKRFSMQKIHSTLPSIFQTAKPREKHFEQHLLQNTNKDNSFKLKKLSIASLTLEDLNVVDFLQAFKTHDKYEVFKQITSKKYEFSKIKTIHKIYDMVYKNSIETKKCYFCCTESNTVSFSMMSNRVNAVFERLPDAQKPLKLEIQQLKTILENIDTINEFVELHGKVTKKLSDYNKEVVPLISELSVWNKLSKITFYDLFLKLANIMSNPIFQAANIEISDNSNKTDIWALKKSDFTLKQIQKILNANFENSGTESSNSCENFTKRDPNHTYSISESQLDDPGSAVLSQPTLSNIIARNFDLSDELLQQTMHIQNVEMSKPQMTLSGLILTHKKIDTNQERTLLRLENLHIFKNIAQNVVSSDANTFSALESFLKAFWALFNESIDFRDAFFSIQNTCDLVSRKESNCGQSLKKNERQKDSIGKLSLCVNSAKCEPSKNLSSKFKKIGYFTESSSKIHTLSHSEVKDSIGFQFWINSIHEKIVRVLQHDLKIPEYSPNDTDRFSKNDNDFILLNHNWVKEALLNISTFSHDITFKPIYSEFFDRVVQYMKTPSDLKKDIVEIDRFIEYFNNIASIIQNLKSFEIISTDLIRLKAEINTNQEYILKNKNQLKDLTEEIDGIRNQCNSLKIEQDIYHLKTQSFSSSVEKVKSQLPKINAAQSNIESRSKHAFETISEMKEIILSVTKMDHLILSVLYAQNGSQILHNTLGSAVRWYQDFMKLNDKVSYAFKNFNMHDEKFNLESYSSHESHKNPILLEQKQYKRVETSTPPLGIQLDNVIFQKPGRFFRVNSSEANVEAFNHHDFVKARNPIAARSFITNEVGSENFNTNDNAFKSNQKMLGDSQGVYFIELVKFITFLKAEIEITCPGKPLISNIFSPNQQNPDISMSQKDIKHLNPNRDSYGISELTDHSAKEFLEIFNLIYYLFKNKSEKRTHEYRLETDIFYVCSFFIFSAFFLQLHLISRNKFTKISEASNKAYERILEYESILEKIRKYNTTSNIRSDLEQMETSLARCNIDEILCLKKSIEGRKKLKDQMINKKHHLLGELATLSKNTKMTQIIDFDQINLKYLAKMSELETLKLLLVDNCKCLKELESRIKDFCSERITDLNNTIKELWIDTYQGNDIDFIMVQSEVSEKTFNYNLVIVKDNILLDMKTRASAGQKMLACILFRIALCDLFSSNFRVLALDEPTTNLDDRNIEALACTLNRLITRTNMQIILITHDTKFANLIITDIEKCYYISRDHLGNSYIEQRILSDK